MHVPVMCAECVAVLGPALSDDRAVLVDGTVGMGGHSRIFLEQFPRLRVVAVDRDPEALAIAADTLAPFGDRVQFIRTRHVGLAAALERAGIEAVNAVLLDLGLSSWQVDTDRRGFAYSRDVPLDMRMDPDDAVTAAEIVNGYAASDLARILFQYGDERHARRIAAAIVAARDEAPILSSRQLVDVVYEAIPAPARRTRGNPAKRTFQALRIEVNSEISDLPDALTQAVAALKVGGRIAVISYHSLEDRAVKRCFAAGSRPRVPPEMPVVPDDALPELRLLMRRAQVPSGVEVSANPRSASARLRAAERVREAA